jgi:hypothetical protein
VTMTMRRPLRPRAPASHASRASRSCRLMPGRQTISAGVSWGVSSGAVAQSGDSRDGAGISSSGTSSGGGRAKSVGMASGDECAGRYRCGDMATRVVGVRGGVGSDIVAGTVAWARFCCPVGRSGWVLVGLDWDQFAVVDTQTRSISAV